MKLGVHVVSFDVAGGAAGIAGTLADLGATAEEAGIENLSVMDHYLQMAMMGGDHDPMLEGYTTLGFLAAHTQTVELQLLVTGVMYRHPGLLAKILATLDVLSEGRAAFGIGAAWYEREHRAYGVPFPQLRERFERLEETLQIVSQMFSDDDGPFEGHHYQLAETICAPRPLHPLPVMVGGSGEKRTLRLVAQYADACNLFFRKDALEDARHKFEVLGRHCEEVGREPDSVRRTVLYQGALDPRRDAEAFLASMAELATLGVDEVHVMPLGAQAADPVAYVRGLGSHVVPGLREI